MDCRRVVEEDLLATPAAECSNPMEGSVSAATPLTVAADEPRLSDPMSPDARFATAKRKEMMARPRCPPVVRTSSAARDQPYRVLLLPCLTGISRGA
jgi:cell division septation protein DedD